jgi:hypothetical protein
MTAASSTVDSIGTPSVRPADLNLQRKAALVAGGAVDHAGRVRVAKMKGFDMGRTIFGSLEGRLPRLMMADKLGKEAFWSDEAIASIDGAYAASLAEQPTPAIDPALIAFMEQECDFSMEHADGSFLEHLVFCHDYAARHYPGHSPNVALLHSILGTGTNTFAMPVSKLPALRELLTDEEALHIEAFPSFVRLFYDQALLAELTDNLHRLDQLKAIHFHRVIDNAELSMGADALWVHLNYQLMHFVDFMPPANWGARRADPLMLQFRELSRFLDLAGRREARVEVAFPERMARPVGERPTVVSTVAGLLPPSLTLKLARKSIRAYSAAIGHSLDYRLEWSASHEA